MNSFKQKIYAFIGHAPQACKPDLPQCKAWHSGSAMLLGFLLLGIVRQNKFGMDPYILLWALPLLLACAIPLARNHDATRHTTSTAHVSATSIILVLFLLLAMGSGWISYSWFYFNYWNPRTLGRNAFGLIAYFGHALLLLVLIKRYPRYWKQAAAIAIIGPMVLTCITMLRSTNWGSALYTDDHPSFLYRLWLIGRTFPQLVNYVPQWSAGIVDVTPVLTGAWIPGILFLPVWATSLPHAYYTPLFGLMYLFLVPLLIGISVRIMGGSRLAALCAATVAVIPTRDFTLWLLHFGTVGANFAMALTVPISALLYRIMHKGGGLGSALGLTICILLMGLWPLSPFMALPMALAVVLHAKALTYKSAGLLAGVAIISCLALYGYYNVILVGGEVVGEGGSGVTIQALNWQSLTQGGRLLREHILRGHPALVFLAVSGAITLLRGHQRSWCLAILGSFILLGGWADALIPGRQLYRMGIPMFFAAIPPAMLAVDRLLHPRSTLPFVLLSLLVALFPITAWNAVSIYTRQSHEVYFPIPNSILELGEMIQREQTEPGRILLTGGIGHEYGGGHIGYLAVLYEREILGNAYAHNQPPHWKAGTPPANPPEDPAFFRFFVDTFSVNMLVAIYDAWRIYLDAQPDHYELVGEVIGDEQRYTVYRVRVPTGFFIEGNGVVGAMPNKLSLQLSRPYERVRIRYRWADGLTVEQPAQLRPYESIEGIQFIEMDTGGETNVIIRFKP